MASAYKIRRDLVIVAALGMLCAMLCAGLYWISLPYRLPIWRAVSGISGCFMFALSLHALGRTVSESHDRVTFAGLALPATPYGLAAILAIFAPSTLVQGILKLNLGFAGPAMLIGGIMAAVGALLIAGRILDLSLDRTLIPADDIEWEGSDAWPT